MPDAKIHFVTKKQFVPVIEANPHIDRIFTIEQKISEVVLQLKKENYDLLIDLHKNLRSKGIIWDLRKPSSTFSKINFEKWLIVNLKINRLPDVHIVDRYFRAVSDLGVRNDGLGLDYFIPGKDEVDLKALPAAHQKGYIGWVIGAKHNTKSFPEDKIIEVCRNISKPVILLGGKEDFEKGERIKLSAGDQIYNACGKYNINQSASLVRQADKIITNDTGLMHIAAAFKKEIISLWGNTIPEFGMYPYLQGDGGGSHILEVKGLSCRPCSKLGFEKCPKGHFRCMKEIDTDELYRIGIP
ncbi:MAG: glycosyltransferase family 9 protein [Bacteroidetes bacterium]|nr:glycosyltransferase family 9 protein [Bacteroidota bacterium]